VTLKLLGPDVPSDYVVTVEHAFTIAQVKEVAKREWPAGGVPAPSLAELRVIHQGRFLQDDKCLKDYKVPDGETTAMHLIIKKQDTKAADAPSGADDKTPKCNCVIC